MLVVSTVGGHVAWRSQPARGESQGRPWESGARPCQLQQRTMFLLRNRFWCVTGPQWREPLTLARPGAHLELPAMIYGPAAVHREMEMAPQGSSPSKIRRHEEAAQAVIPDPTSPTMVPPALHPQLTPMAISGRQVSHMTSVRRREKVQA